MQAGAQSDALVSSIDLTATILDYGGASLANIDGKTLRPLLEGKATEHRKVVYSGLGGWRMAWDGRYKVITGFAPELTGINEDGMCKYEPRVASRSPLVFDLESDPKERNNLAAIMPAAAQDTAEEVGSRGVSHVVRYSRSISGDDLRCLPCQPGRAREQLA